MDKQPTTKQATLFDLINGVTSSKKHWTNWSETDQKKFSPYMVNRFLSMRMELVEIINELQKYTIGLLSPRETYYLYYDLLPTNKSFAKYIKGNSEDKYHNDLIKQVAEHYKVSQSEAIDYIQLMPKDSCVFLLQKYGYSEKDIKTLTKGL